MNVVGYVRVSTKEQADEGLSLEAQRAAVHDAAFRRGWNLQWTFSDEGVSAKSMERYGLQGALEMLGDGGAEVLMVTKLDRLSRSMIDFASLVERSQSEGWSIVVLDQDLDLTTPTGRLFAHLLAALAQWEREMIGQRTKEALAHKKANGGKLGPPVRVQPGVASFIGTSRDSGSSFSDIALALNLEGIASPTGGRWTAAAVRGVHNRHNIRASVL